MGKREGNGRTGGSVNFLNGNINKKGKNENLNI